MQPETHLEIIWDGPVNGLDRHRVSLAAFGEPMKLLLTAARRIASTIVTNAVEEKTVGRLAKEATGLDIELTGLVEGSGGFSAVMTLNAGHQVPLFAQLPELVGKDLISAIKDESAGILRNSSVRNYLGSLPAALTRQRYSLHENGKPIMSVDIGSVTLPQALAELPHLAEIKGRVVGVGFEPGRSEIRVKTEDLSISISATPAQVEVALRLRATEVRVLFLKNGSKLRLLRIEDSSGPRFTGDPEVAIYARWDKLLHRLAQ